MPRTLKRAGVNANEEIPPKGSEKFESLLVNLKNKLFKEPESNYQFSLKESALILMARANPKLFVVPLLLSQAKEEPQIKLKVDQSRVIENDVAEVIFHDNIHEVVEKVQETAHLNFPIESKEKVEKTNSDIRCINSSNIH